MWAHALTTALGVWLMAAPQILDYHGAARTNDHVIGPLIATFGCVAMWQATRPVRWVNLVLGIWLTLAPWLLGYAGTQAGGTATANSMAVGVLTAVLALVRGAMRHQVGGGWSALWRHADPRPGNTSVS